MWTKVVHGFEDPDPKFEWPPSIHSRIDLFKRPCELFADKLAQICVVDAENGGLENFDLIGPNEHLHSSEVSFLTHLGFGTFAAIVVY